MISSAQWGEYVRQWQQSGEAAEEFAKRHKFKVESLMWWRGKFEREAAKRKAAEQVKLVPVVEQIARAASPEQQGNAQIPQAIVEDGAGMSPSGGAMAVVMPALQRAGGGETVAQVGLVLELGRVRIHLERGFDAVLLKQVIHTLEAV